MIRPNDVVLHKPSGETWVVCGVDHERGELIPCGQPEEYKTALARHGLYRFIERTEARDDG